MNNLKYFVDLEKETGNRGIGDIREASLINIRKHELFIQVDGDERKKIEIGPPPGIVYDEKALYHPVFCMVGKIFYLDKTGEREYSGHISLPKETVNEFTNTDDTSVLVIYNVTEFLNKVHSAAEREGIAGKHGFINYRDLRIPNFVKGKWILDSTFTKDIFFEKQSEFRIELFKHSSSPYTLRIGDITDYSCLVKPEQIRTGLDIIQTIE